MMAPDPSVFVIDDDRSSVLPTRRCLLKLVQRAGVPSTAEHKTKVSFPFAG